MESGQRRSTFLITLGGESAYTRLSGTVVGRTAESCAGPRLLSTWTGSPLATVAGAVGAVSIAIGLSALTFTLKTTINEGGRWAIKVVGKGEVERRQGDDGDGEMRLRVKPTLSGSQTLLGTLGGLLLGGGTLATLQETATSLPTIELALELVLPTTILGMLTGLFRLAKT